jgi:hypothetical protein
MKKNYFKKLKLAALGLMIGATTPALSQVTMTFTFTGGAQSFTVPPCVGNMTITAWGGMGSVGGSSGSSGGNGGSVRGVITATPGQVMYFYVGGQGSVTAGGFNGGGNGGGSSSSSGGGGGGASDVRVGGTALSNRILVAAGGGGGGGSSYASTLFSGPSYTAGNSAGHGSIVITYTFNGTQTNVSPTFTAICNGGSATLNGTGASTYTWLPVGTFPGSNNAQIVVSPGTTTTYTLNGTNSLGCVSNTLVTVNVTTSAPVLSVNTSTNNLCLGKTATITASGALTYTISSGNVPVTNGQSFIPSTTTTYTIQGQNGCGITTAFTTITVAPLPVSVLASPSLVCQGYSSTLQAVSAASGYTWYPQAVNGSSTIVAPMANTVYTVVASDGTCSGVAQLTVNTKVTPTITATTNNTMICEGQTATLTASGGSTYVWTPGGNGATINVTPSVNTLYSVAGTNSVGCTANAQVPIIVNQAPVITVTVSKNPVCVNSPVTFTAGGATSYNWTNGPQTAVNTVTATGSAIYTVSGSFTNNCSSTKTVALNVVIPNVSVSTPTAICNGDNATLTASGANTYSWNGVPGSAINVVSPTVTTVYLVSANTISSSITCPSTKTVQLVVNPNPTVTIALTKTLICKGQSNTITANGAVNYSWQPTASGNPAVISPTITTLYNVTGYDNNGCSSSAFTQVVVSTCPGFAEYSANNHNVYIYPNPNAGEFSVKTDNDLTLQLLNAVGQQLKVVTLNESNQRELRIKDLPSGVYFLVGENKDGKVNQKIVVSK